MKGINYSNEFRYSFHVQNYINRKMLKNIFPRRNIRILCSIIGIIFLYFPTEVKPTYAEENIVITLRNFFDVGNSRGDFYYTPIKEDGIPASEHILIIKSHHCLDDAKDNDGIIYYFYMVDRSKGLKALITEKALDPTEELDEYIYEFVDLVKEEMRKDGGVVAIIEKFKKFSAGQ
jgi:hypothetical protein